MKFLEWVYNKFIYNKIADNEIKIFYQKESDESN